MGSADLLLVVAIPVLAALAAFLLRDRLVRLQFRRRERQKDRENHEADQIRRKIFG